MVASRFGSWVGADARLCLGVLRVLRTGWRGGKDCCASGPMALGLDATLVVALMIAEASMKKLDE